MMPPDRHVPGDMACSNPVAAVITSHAATSVVAATAMSHRGLLPARSVPSPIVVLLGRG